MSIRRPLEVVAGAVDGAAALVDVEIAAAREVVGAGKNRDAVRLPDFSWLLNNEEAGAVERDVGIDRGRS